MASERHVVRAVAIGAMTHGFAAAGGMPHTRPRMPSLVAA
jgi:hypothetical protein